MSTSVPEETLGGRMERDTLLRRNLLHFARSHLSVALGVAAGCATLCGALLVGDSMRGSLRDAAIGRLGQVDHALVAQRFFRAALADEIATDRLFHRHFDRIVPTILLSGAAVHAASEARASRVSVLGVDERFWQVGSSAEIAPALSGRNVILNRALADKLGAAVGDDVLIRVGKVSAISTETLLGRRDDATTSLRLAVASILPNEGVGSFTLNPRQYAPLNAFVPLDTLRRALAQPGGANALLVQSNYFRRHADRSGLAVAASLHSTLLKDHQALADFGLRLRIDDTQVYASLEADAMLLPSAAENAARTAADHASIPAAGVMTYLANEIADVREDSAQSDSVIPYSTVAALELDSLETLLSARQTRRSGGSNIIDGPEVRSSLKPGEILLNDWTANELNAHVGDRIRLTYYVAEPGGRLDTREATFTLAGIVPLTGAAADPGFTPDYPGVTDAERLSDWDPPFPVDLKKIRDRDEDYWKQHRGTPKAFITMADGERLWAEQQGRFGRLTSLRIRPAPGGDLDSTADRFASELRARLNPKALGLAFEPVRAQALASADGNTDFGGLFIGFSFFLIVSAAMLVALLFRLGVEQRAKELGLLLALGFRPRQVTRLLVVEGAIVAMVGALLGLPLALGYAWLMLAGLRSWWSAAVNAPFLKLHVSTPSLSIGVLASVLLALLAIAWTMRGLKREPVRALLAGAMRGSQLPLKRRSRRVAQIVAVAAFALAATLVIASAIERIPASAGFFGGGAAALVGCLAIARLWLAHLQSRAASSDSQRAAYRVISPGPAALIELGARNAARAPGRSLLTIGLVASAAFLIISLEAFRLDAATDVAKRDSGSGGFALIAEATTPLPYDLRTPAGRAELSLLDDTSQALASAKIVPFRLRPGDETSCLNLYRSNRPRIIGATDDLIARGGFAFGASEAETPEERANPWLLLRKRFDDGAIPVIGDEAAVQWQLHLGLGQELVVSDERGNTKRLRFVALLRGSILQGELAVAEDRFIELFPSISGYAFFLLDAAEAARSILARNLERDLGAFGVELTSSSRRLAEYFAVQNTYLSTFQALGGLGLILGTIGLAAVLLRNVWERRSELALMQALGFRRRSVARIVLAENVALVCAGLLAGAVPALLAIAPQIAAHARELPWFALLSVLVGVFAAGLGAGALAAHAALRAPLLAALRSE